MSSHVKVERVADTGYSLVEKGDVEFGAGSHSRRIPYVQETPHELISNDTYVLAKGWSAGLGFLNVPRSRLAKKYGYRVITPGYAHHDSKHPIRRDAEDFEAVTNELGVERARLGGHSMGSAVIVVAAPFLEAGIVSASLVQPALMRDNESPEALMARAAKGMQDELRNVIMNPFASSLDASMQELAVSLDGMVAYQGRSRVLRAEQERMTRGNMHERVEFLSTMEGADGDPVQLFMIAGQRDALFPPEDLEKAAAHLPFTDVQTYLGRNATHACFSKDAGMTDLMVDMHAAALQSPAMVA